MVTSFALNPNNCIKKQFSVGNTKAYFSIVVKIDMQGKIATLKCHFFIAIYSVSFFQSYMTKVLIIIKTFFQKITILGF